MLANGLLCVLNFLDHSHSVKSEAVIVFDRGELFIGDLHNASRYGVDLILVDLLNELLSFVVEAGGLDHCALFVD